MAGDKDVPNQMIQPLLMRTKIVVKMYIGKTAYRFSKAI